MDPRLHSFLTALFLLTGSIFFLVEIYYLTPMSR
jgi:hypothetical protein